jgi:CubicO group peptidase (beta-lactamase class C family)
MRTNFHAILLALMVILPACQPAQMAAGSVTVDSGELENFADAFFTKQMDKLHIPGLAFVFVQGDEVVFAKGYGYANLERSIPIDPETTVMGIGSISKPLVATAVMQLVEQGKLDLRTDINQYLTTFQLADTYPEPITLAHLLAHTAGFEDPPYVSNSDPGKVQPLRDYLAANMPPRTYPPGEVYIYCSHGYDLAALVVEEVTGEPFDQYIEQNIFNPLGMKKSLYLRSSTLPEGMATGYFYQDGVQIPQPLDYDNGYPSGSIVSTRRTWRDSSWCNYRMDVTTIPVSCNRKRFHKCTSHKVKALIRSGT